MLPYFLLGKKSLKQLRKSHISSLNLKYGSGVLRRMRFFQIEEENGLFLLLWEEFSHFYVSRPL